MPATEPSVVALTSVGSLVGQVVLDALEGRRESFRLIGCNTAPDNPNVFRCDRAYLVPPTNHPDYEEAIAEVMQRERADLVIPGRDPDILQLTQMAETDRPLPVLGGTAAMAQVMADKAATARFCRSRSLPFVDSAETGKADSQVLVERLLGDHGFPLIAKPATGSGSEGVRVIAQREQIDGIVHEPGLLIQPFLDPPGELEPPDAAGTPLFWAVREDRLHAVQVLIAPNGDVGPSCTFKAEMVLGRCERLDLVDDPSLTAVALAFAEAASVEGWRGPFNVQAKKDRDGAWKVIELNGRFSGGTSARRHLGFDEVALVLNQWLGTTIAPATAPNGARTVIRQFTDRVLDPDAIAHLRHTGSWSNPAS